MNGKSIGISILVALVLVIGVLVTPVLANGGETEVWVDGGFTDAETGWGVTHFDTIQAGIDAVAEDGTVNVAAGIYSEQLLIQHSLNLIGAGETTAVIEAPATRFRSVNEAEDTWDYIVAAYPLSGTIDVRIEGFTIDADTQAMTGETDGLVGVFLRDVQGVDAGLYSCTIEGFEAAEYESWGIKVYGDSSLTIHDNTLTDYTRDGIVVNGDGGGEADPDVTISNNDLTGSALCLNGIQIGEGATGAINGNTVRNHTRSSPWAAVGILISNSDEVTINGGNHVENCHYGIHLLNADECMVSGNTLEDNVAFHIGLNNADGNTISSNEITGTEAGSEDKAIGLSGGADANIIGGDAEADGNTISLATSGSGGLYAVYVQSTVADGSNTIKYNTIDGSTRSVQVDGGNTGTTTVANNTVGSTTPPSFAGVYFNAGNAVISENTLINTVRPIEFQGAADVTITGNTINGATFDAINCGSASGTVTIGGETAALGNEIYNGSGSGISCKMNDIAIKHNEIHDCAVGITIVEGCTGVTANKNGIYDNTGPGIQNNDGNTVVATGNWWGDASGPYQAETNAAATGDAVSTNVAYDPWYSNAEMTQLASGKPVQNTNKDTSYDTIQAAIDDAGEGDTINVAAGTYEEALAIDVEDITLNGAHQDEDPEGSLDRGDESFITGGDISITGEGASLNGFKTDQKIVVDAEDVRVEYNISTGAPADAIHLNNDRAEGGYIGYNTVSASGALGIYTASNDSVLIERNQLLNTAGNAIECGYHSGTDIQVLNNIITSSGGKGINYWGGDGATITGNSIDGTAHEGIHLSGTHENDIVSNNIVNNTNTVNGVAIFSIKVETKAQITGNAVTNSKDGIRVEYVGSSTADRVEVVNNTVSNIEYAGINILGAYAYVNGNTVHDCNYYGDDGDIDFDYASIHMEASATDCIIDGNTVYDGVNGIQTWANDTTITNNEIYDMGLTYANEKEQEGRLYMNSAVIVGSYWASDDYRDPTGIVIQDNSIHDNYWGLFHSAELSNGVTATSNWWGDASGPSGDGPGSGDAISPDVAYDPWYSNAEMNHLASSEPVQNVTQATFYKTIQAALNAAAEDDTIEVSAGTYEENLTISTGVTLQGADAETTIISSDSTTAITIVSNGVTIAGFTITNPSGKHGIYAADRSDISITNNIVTDIGTGDGSTSGTNFGIAIICSGAAVADITITGNQIDTIAGGNNKSVDAIAIGWSNGDYNVTNLLIQNNEISGITSDDTVAYAEGGRGANGIFINHGSSGTGQVVDAQILDNTVSDLAGLWSHGIALEGDTPNALVRGNTVRNLTSTKHIIYESPPHNWNDAVAVMVEENDSANTVTITKNSFSDAGYGVYTKSGAVNAAGNWWGDASGPSETGPGTGVAVNEDVVYDPWYADEAMNQLASGKKVQNVTQGTSHDTIQEAIDAAADDDTITVAAGTYDETIDIDKRISLIGAGSDNETGTILQNTVSPEDVAGQTYGSFKPVVILSASGLEETPVLIKDLLILPRHDVVTSGQLPAIFPRPGLQVSHVELDNVHVTGTLSGGTFESGIAVDGGAGLDNLTVNNCRFSNMAYGMIIWAKSGTAWTAQGITINNTTFHRNSIKGIYAEKLSDATFTNLDITNNGNVTLVPNWAEPWNAGIDINLKYGDYQNISFNNLTVTGNGIESVNGAGLTVKARGTGNDSPDYMADHATLDNVTVNGGTFTGNQAGIRFGEPEKNNTGPTNITVINATITGNTDFNFHNLVAGVIVNAADNWWGSANGPAHAGNTYNIASQGANVTDNVLFTPWLDAADGESFAPVTNGSSGYPSIQAAIDDASSGDTIDVAAGMFSERISVTQPLTLRGATYNVNKNGYFVPEGYAWDITKESVITNPEPALTKSDLVYINDTDDVTFEGFIVQSLNALQGSNNDHLVTIEADAFTMDNINIRNNVIGPNTNVPDQDGTHGRMGLYINVNQYLETPYGLTHSSIDGNKIFGCEGNGNNVFIWAAYYKYDARHPSPMEGTVIEDNEISGSHRSGIETAGGFKDLIIRNNRIFNNIALSGDDPGLKYGNGIVMIRGSQDRTVNGHGPEDVVIENNEIYSNSGHGIYMGPNNDGIDITGNKLYNNGFGVEEVEDTKAAILVDLIGHYYNPDFDTGPGPYTNLSGSEDVTASQNTIYDNAMGIEVIGTPANGFELDATDNFWKTSDSTAVAGMVSGAVDYDPWHLKDALSDLGTSDVSLNSVVLEWTTANSWSDDYYDFRYSTSPIVTTDDWNSAKRITGEPEVSDGAHKMIVRKLSSDTTYYFVLTMAYSNTGSAMSTTSVQTSAVVVPDETAPTAVSTLAAVAGSPATTRVVLSWDATGDDGNDGFASKYIIKRSTEPITADNFDAATTLYNNLTPKVSGSAESFTVKKLSAGTTYHFAIKVQDEAGNTSDISNVVSIGTVDLLPTVSSISPATGDNGEARTLTINGSNFLSSGTTVVRLTSPENTFALKSVTYVSATELTAVVPAGVPTGTYRARVINNNGTSALSPVVVAYTVTEAPTPLPVVTNLVPQLAASNTLISGVQIFGNNLTGATAVKVNGAAATNVSVISDTKITADIPGLTAGEYEVKVTTPGGTNDVSAVKFAVTDPVVVNSGTTEDTTTSGVIDLDTNVIPVQITLTTDDSETATKNTDVDAEISVVIPPATTITDNEGNAYTGEINPPRVVKPDESVIADLPEDVVVEDIVVIEMGNTEETINFDQDFVATVTVSADAEPDIYYYNKDSGQYELAGKTGSKDGVDYVPGGTVLGLEDSTYTIGLLLDHMSVYVASVESLIVPESPTTPNTGDTGGGGGGGGAPAEPPLGTTDIRGIITSAGVFTEALTTISDDGLIKLTIPEGTVGLTLDLEPIEAITMLPADEPPAVPEGAHIIGMAYELKPDGASFDPPIMLSWSYDPDALPEDVAEEDLKVAFYDEECCAWDCTECGVDTENNIVTAPVKHFTTFAIISLPPASFSLEPLVISSGEVAAGEPVSIGFTVTNNGKGEGSYTAVLKINGEEEASKQITLAPGGSEMVFFSVARNKAGTYTISIGEQSASFSVVVPPAPERTPSPAVTPAPRPASPEPAETPADLEPSPQPSPLGKWTPLVFVLGLLVVVLIVFFVIRLVRAR